MNEIIQSLYARKSVRVFTDEPISSSDKETILRAAMMAPTAGNQQLYTILDITDQSIKDTLAVTCDNQPFIAKAPLVFVFCADFQKWYDAFLECGCNPRLPGVGDLMLAVQDAMIAAQNAVVAAESLGIGSCYIGDIMEHYEEHKDLLMLPDYVFPATMLVLGYPTKQQTNRLKPQRCDLEYMVHTNHYNRMAKDELRSLFQKKPGELSYENWMTAFCKRKYNSDFAREMSRSVNQYIKLFSQSF